MSAVSRIIRHAPPLADLLLDGMAGATPSSGLTDRLWLGTCRALEAASATHTRLRSKRRDEELLRAMTSSGGKVGNYGHLLYEHAVQSAKKKERIREEKR